MKGRIFNIQRFSIHDGPGIRTTVFMKGCNLRCRWCHNPESQERGNHVMFYGHKCKGCGSCREICDKMFTDRCTNCGNCAQVCPYDARELCGRDITADELMAELVKDQKFYETSGGGVTFSGGEPLLQSEFLEEMLVRCAQAGIHTAIETAANVPLEIFEKIVTLADMMICDVKCIDEELHIRGTGVSNRQILANVSYLMKSDAEFLLRMPYIPGFNESQADAVAEFAGDAPLELMPYHSIGSGKYGALGREYDDDEFTVPDKERLEEIAARHKNVFFEK